MSRRRSKAQTTEELHADDDPLTAFSARSESDIPQPLTTNTEKMRENFVDETLDNESEARDRSSSPEVISHENPNVPTQKAAAKKRPINSVDYKAQPQQAHQQEAQDDWSSDLQELDERAQVRKQKKIEKAKETPKKTKNSGRQPAPPKYPRGIFRDDAPPVREQDTEDRLYARMNKADRAAVILGKDKGKSSTHVVISSDLQVAGKAKTTAPSGVHREYQDHDSPAKQNSSEAKLRPAHTSTADATSPRKEAAVAVLTTLHPGTEEVSFGSQGPGEDNSDLSRVHGDANNDEDLRKGNYMGKERMPPEFEDNEQVEQNASEVEVESMLHDIIRQAHAPREWLQFIGRKDYNVDNDTVLLESSGHRDTPSLLHAIFHKINDTLDRKYSRTRIDHRHIHIQLNAAIDTHSIPSPDIFKAYSGLSELLGKLSTLSLTELAQEVKPVCRDIVETAKYLFLENDDARGFIVKPQLSWSFVVLLVNTVLSQPDIYDALRPSGVSKGKHYLTHQDQVSDLLKYLRHNSGNGKYKKWSTAKITRVWETLQKRLQKEYALATQSAAGSNDYPGRGIGKSGARRVSRESVPAPAAAAAIPPKQSKKRQAPSDQTQDKKKKRTK